MPQRAMLAATHLTNHSLSYTHPDTDKTQRRLDLPVALAFAGAIDTLVPNLNNPESVFVDKDGNVFIADTDNNRIK